MPSSSMDEPRGENREMSKGVYNLIIYMDKEKNIQIGKLGRFFFPVGYYVYTGSALNNLEARTERHRKKGKKLKWHIDYLLEHAQVEDVKTYFTEEKVECLLNKSVLEIPGAQMLVSGFGSSDCKCISHLIYFRKKPTLERKGHSQCLSASICGSFQ